MTDQPRTELNLTERSILRAAYDHGSRSDDAGTLTRKAALRVLELLERHMPGFDRSSPRHVYLALMGEGCASVQQALGQPIPFTRWSECKNEAGRTMLEVFAERMRDPAMLEQATYRYTRAPA